jgi:hypothetical protein
MNVAPLFNESAAQRDGNIEVEITHEDLTQTGAGTAQTLLAFKVKAALQSIQLINLELIEPFQDTATASTDSLLVEIGDDGDTDRLCTSTQININGTEVRQKQGTGTVHIFAADNTVDFLFTPKTGTTLASLNRGKLRATFRLMDCRPD